MGFTPLAYLHRGGLGEFQCGLFDLKTSLLLQQKILAVHSVLFLFYDLKSQVPVMSECGSIGDLAMPVV